MRTKPTILLADDDAALLENVQRLLESEFEIVATVRDGQALLEAAQTLAPDLVIADISMPILNGFQAARRLKATRPDAKFLFLTVHEEEPFIAEAKKVGAMGYVLKRCSPSCLIPAIHEIFQGHSFVCPTPPE